MGDRGGFRGGFGGDRGGRGGRGGRGDRGGRGGRGDRGGRGGRRGGEPGKEEWVPCTKLGRLVKQGKIKTLEHIYLFSMPIKEWEIVDYFLGAAGTGKLKDEVMKVQPVQKQTRAGQRTRFKAFVLVGDFDGHVGLGVKVGKEVANAIRGAILAAKMQVIPVRRGYWGRKIGQPHTVPNKIHGKSGSVHIRLVPAPRGTGIVAAPTSKKILQYAGIHDVFTSSNGASSTLGNFAKATFYSLKCLYGYLSPDLWKDTRFTKQPFQEFTDDLSANKQVIKSRGAADKYS
jgi:small subunit ribosomal protein S2e